MGCAPSKAANAVAEQPKQPKAAQQRPPECSGKPVAQRKLEVVSPPTPPSVVPKKELSSVSQRNEFPQVKPEVVPPPPPPQEVPKKELCGVTQDYQVCVPERTNEPAVAKSGEGKEILFQDEAAQASDNLAVGSDTLVGGIEVLENAKGNLAHEKALISAGITNVELESLEAQTAHERVAPEPAVLDEADSHTDSLEPLKAEPVFAPLAAVDTNESQRSSNREEAAVVENAVDPEEEQRPISITTDDAVGPLQAKTTDDGASLEPAIQYGSEVHSVSSNSGKADPTLELAAVTPTDEEMRSSSHEKSVIVTEEEAVIVNKAEGLEQEQWSVSITSDTDAYYLKAEPTDEGASLEPAIREGLKVDPTLEPMAVFAVMDENLSSSNHEESATVKYTLNLGEEEGPVSNNAVGPLQTEATDERPSFEPASQDGSDVHSISSDPAKANPVLEPVAVVPTMNEEIGSSVREEAAIVTEEEAAIVENAEHLEEGHGRISITSENVVPCLQVKTTEEGAFRKPAIQDESEIDPALEPVAVVDTEEELGYSGLKDAAIVENVGLEDHVKGEPDYIAIKAEVVYESVQAEPSGGIPSHDLAIHYEAVAYNVLSELGKVDEPVWDEKLTLSTAEVENVESEELVEEEPVSIGITSSSVIESFQNKPADEISSLAPAVQDEMCNPTVSSVVNAANKDAHAGDQEVADQSRLEDVEMTVVATSEQEIPPVVDAVNTQVNVETAFDAQTATDEFAKSSTEVDNNVDTPEEPKKEELVQAVVDTEAMLVPCGNSGTTPETTPVMLEVKTTSTSPFESVFDCPDTGADELVSEKSKTEPISTGEDTTVNPVIAQDQQHNETQPDETDAEIEPLVVGAAEFVSSPGQFIDQWRQSEELSLCSPVEPLEAFSEHSQVDQDDEASRISNPIEKELEDDEPIMELKNVTSMTRVFISEEQMSNKPSVADRWGWSTTITKVKTAAFSSLNREEPLSEVATEAKRSTEKQSTHLGDAVSPPTDTSVTKAAPPPPKIELEPPKKTSKQLTDIEKARLFAASVLAETERLQSQEDESKPSGFWWKVGS